MGRVVEVPGWTIDFGDHEEVTTKEVLEELGISYECLLKRINTMRFPAPVRSGHNGKTALYNRDAVDWWCMKKNFKVSPRVK